MNASARIPHLAAYCAVIILLLVPTSHAITHQGDYNNERDEYCYKESINLGTCVGEQVLQKNSDQLKFTPVDSQIEKCFECSGNFHGPVETCADLKALNDVERVSNGTDGSINWHESFCETYNICVEENCPKECLREQDEWIECLIIELDCDWRCPGSTWLDAEGSRTMGLGPNSGVAAALGGVNFLPRGVVYNSLLLGTIVLIGAVV